MSIFGKRRGSMNVVASGTGSIAVGGSMNNVFVNGKRLSGGGRRAFHLR